MINIINRKIFRSLAVVGATLGVGIGATYASFVSNTVTIADNVLTTGQAEVKLCNVSKTNSWTTSLSPSINLAQIVPNEERNLFPSDTIFVGNDDGGLTTRLGSGQCTTYADPVGHSSTPFKLLPTAVFDAATCPDPLGTNVRLRFEINGTDTGYRTLNSWVTNATLYDPTINTSEALPIKVFAQLSSTATAQNGSCKFTINLAGKQT